MSHIPLLVLGAVLVLCAAAVGGLIIQGAAIWIRSRGELRCPHCGSRDVRYSHTADWQYAIHRWLSCSPYRCRACWGRFYHIEARPPEAVDTE